MGTTAFFKAGTLLGELDFIEQNLNILAHAQTIELEIGSRCGGHGICGGDLLRVMPDSKGSLSPVTEIERKHFSAAELEKGYRLACQCFPNDAEGALCFEVFSNSGK